MDGIMAMASSDTYIFTFFSTLHFCACNCICMTSFHSFFLCQKYHLFIHPSICFPLYVTCGQIHLSVECIQLVLCARPHPNISTCVVHEQVTNAETNAKCTTDAAGVVWVINVGLQSDQRTQRGQILVGNDLHASGIAAIKF